MGAMISILRVGKKSEPKFMGLKDVLDWLLLVKEWSSIKSENQFETSIEFA